VRRSIARALVFLERDGNDWMEGRAPFQNGKGCVSCHHVGFALWSHREAQRAGLAIPVDRIRDLERRGRAFFTDDSSTARPVSSSEMLLGREIPAVDHGADESWRWLVDQTAVSQSKAGFWSASGQFSSQKRPVVESDAAATMWVVLAFASLSQPPPGSPMRERLDQALAWLRSSPAGVSNEWLVGRLLVELRFGTPQAADGLLRRLLGQQRPDGGWSWLASEASNAFSTGETLYALRVAGLAPGHPAVRRAVSYLLGNQKEDGTWVVASGLISKKSSPSRDYIYKYWGTAWATIGLARVPDGEPVAARRPARLRAGR
jgi:hypothetical protein